MANDFTDRTWIIDTAGATSKYTGPVFIGRISWHPSAAGQTLTVANGLGNVQWTVQSVAAGNDSSVGIEDWPNPEHRMPWDGFQVTTMNAGGKLYVTVI